MNFEELIKSKGFEYQEFAIRVSKCESTVRSWANGTNRPKSKLTMKDISRALRVSVEEVEKALEETKNRPAKKICCKLCGKEVVKTNKQKIFCSIRCRLEYYRVRKKKWNEMATPLSFGFNANDNFDYKIMKTNRIMKREYTRDELQQATQEFLKKKSITKLKPSGIPYEQTRIGKQLSEIDIIEGL